MKKKTKRRSRKRVIARWSTQLRRECWVATGITRYQGAPFPQGTKLDSQTPRSCNANEWPAISETSTPLNVFMCFLIETLLTPGGYSPCAKNLSPMVVLVRRRTHRMGKQKIVLAWTLRGAWSETKIQYNTVAVPARPSARQLTCVRDANLGLSRMMLYRIPETVRNFW